MICRETENHRQISLQTKSSCRRRPGSTDRPIERSPKWVPAFAGMTIEEWRYDVLALQFAAGFRTGDRSPDGDRDRALRHRRLRRRGDLCRGLFSHPAALALLRALALFPSQSDWRHADPGVAVVLW